MHGVSTRNYKQVIPQMAETAGVSRSAVSRAAIEASEAEVEALLSRRFDDLKLLVIYIDGLVFGDYTMIGVVGVDAEGHKHVLGIREGATENSTVTTELLEDIVSRGVDPKRKMLFVIDGSKALRAAINAVFGTDQKVQRCRAHKLRNVLDDPACHPLAERQDGFALDGFGLPRNRETLQAHHGAQRPVGARSDSEPHCDGQQEDRVVTST
jgi:transposase-like protein